MTLLGKGVLAIWNGITADSEDEFLKWHVHEHIPERVFLPGFQRGRRYVSLDGHPRFFNFYETDTSADLSSEAYRAELNRPTPWTQQVVRNFTDTSRTVCDVAISAGCGEGVVIETVRLSSDVARDQFFERMKDEVVLPLAGRHNIVGVHLLEGQADQRRVETAETRLRGGADEIADWVLLIEAVQPGAIALLRRDLASDEHLFRCGAKRDLRRGSYALQFSLSKPELLAKANA